MRVFTTIIGLVFCVTAFSQTENDCVFNNDYKGLTTEWLNQIGKTDFVWNADSNQAEIYSKRDTIFVSKGGCVHSGRSVSLIISNDPHTINDSEYWLNKALILAIDFDFKHYKEMIQENKLKRVQYRKDLVLFNVEEGNYKSNLIYNGVEIRFEKKHKVVRLSQYYN
jgi:hypothetical protein